MKKNQKLSLEAFKTKNINSKDSEELEKLTGAILGSCHPEPPKEPSTYEKFYDRFKHGTLGL